MNFGHIIYDLYTLFDFFFFFLEIGLRRPDVRLPPTRAFEHRCQYRRSVQQLGV